MAIFERADPYEGNPEADYIVFELFLTADLKLIVVPWRSVTETELFEVVVSIWKVLVSLRLYHQSIDLSVLSVVSIRNREPSIYILELTDVFFFLPVDLLSRHGPIHIVVRLVHRTLFVGVDTLYVLPSHREQTGEFHAHR